MNIDDKRGTERTTTLLRAALQRASDTGKTMMIVVSSHHEFDHMIVLMGQICSTSQIPFKVIQHSKTFVVGENLRLQVLALGNDAIDTRNFIVRGIDEKDTFFDHHAIESIIGRKAFDLWIRYDHPSTKIRRNFLGQVI